MARNLQRAGFVVHVWNRSPERARPLEPEGAKVYGDPRAATEGCSLTITMLSDANAVLDTAERAIAALAPDGLWIQMSTIGLDGTQRCAELADRAGVRFVDAPVLGTRAPAQQGALVILASGPDSAHSACEPVFEAIGARTIWLGPAGAGSRLKVVINGWIVGVVTVLAETISLAEALDVDPQLFFEAVADGPLDLPYARMKGAAMIEKSFEDPSFRLALARKDGDLMLSAAQQAGIELPVMEAVVKRLGAVEASGHGGEDLAATYWASAPRSGSRSNGDGGSHA